MTRIAVPNSSRRRSGRASRWFLLLLVLSAGATALWTWVSLQWSYSDGERAGVLQKFSRRGWLCKTQEGELAQYVVAGVSPQIWQFSVRDPAVAAQLDKAVGERVQLHYSEHRGVPSSCFGDTRYYVDRVTVRAESGATAAPAPPPAPAPTPRPPPAAAPAPQ